MGGEEYKDIKAVIVVVKEKAKKTLICKYSMNLVMASFRKSQESLDRLSRQTDKLEPRKSATLVKLWQKK